MGAQNLVINGDLEGGVGTTSFFSLPGWERFMGSPDVHNEDFNWAQIPAKSGVGFIGFYQYGTQIELGPNYVREFIRGELSSPLQAGRTYELSFWIRPSLDDGLGRNMAIDRMGALLTSYIPEADSWMMFSEEPQFEFLSPMYSNLEEWVEVKGCFVAEGGERYITLGNFRTDEETNSEPLAGATWEYYGYYLIDDINLSKVDYELLPEEPGMCEGDSEILSAIASDGAEIAWGNGLVGDSLEVNSPGEYSVSIDFGHCTVQDQITVLQLEPPVSTVSLPIALCEGEFVELQYLGTEQLEWSSGENFHSIEVSQPGLYTLTKWNDCGSAIDEFLVVEKECSCEVWLPNAFTPDNNGLNELFGPVAHCELYSYHFQVFDNWGNEVFSSNDPQQLWNGTGVKHPDYLLPSGVYNWRISYEQFDSNLVQLVGSVALIR